MVNVLKFQKLFSFCSQIKCCIIRARIHKMLIIIANREDPDQTASTEAVKQTEKILIRLLLQKQSDQGLHCLSIPFLAGNWCSKF